MSLLLDFLTYSFSTLIILFILAVFMLLNRGEKIPASGVFRTAILVLVLITILDFLESIFAGKIGDFDLPVVDCIRLRTVTSTLLYMLRPVVILLQLILVAPSPRFKIPCIILSVINAAIYLPSLFGARFAFWIDQHNEWHGEALHYTVYIVQLIYVGLLYIFSVFYFNNDNVKHSILLLAIVFLAVTSAFFEVMNLLPDRVTQVTAICTLAYYLYLTSIYQHDMLVRIAENKLKMEQDKMAILRDQIQPHFIYNSLNIIQTLVQTDPNTTLEAIEHFSDYLQAHFRGIQSEHMITFEQELENVRAYLALAQADYTRKVEVVYDLQELDFRIPQLSLEPVVENAVKHGTGMNGGTITIASWDTFDSHVVSVTDSGSSENQLTEKQKKRLGVGIANTKSRLAALCKGTLEMEKHGEGTTVRILIPKHLNDTKETEESS